MIIKVGLSYLQQVRTINNNVLPTVYGNLFYEKVKKCHPIILLAQKEETNTTNKLINIGGLIAFQENKTYTLATLAVYTKYQHLTVGTQLLELLIQKVKELEFRTINVQVSVENELALQFYIKHSFKRVKIIPKAYPRLKNPKAYLLSLLL